MMTPQLQEALEWVNHMRTGPLRARPLDELPKGVPGHTAECVIARALKLGVIGVNDVKVNNADHMVHIERGPLIHGSNPEAVRQLIREFDTGNLRHLIDYDTFNKMNPHGHMVHQSMAKPFDKLLPKLAQFYPELHVNPHSIIEVSQSFDSMMHVVTVKNPGECPKAVELTATMVHQMQKHMEEEMQKAMSPPMWVSAGKLTPMQKSVYYAPDWANMMKQTPEAPVKAPSEELTVV